MRRNENLVVINEPKSPRSEEYRILRTNIEYSLVDKEKKIIMVTSSMPGEGKSTTAANLAASLQQLDRKVILIDCDQRKPMVHKNFSLSNVKGLSDYLVNNKSLGEYIQKTSIDGLDILTSGTIPPNPSELLSSRKMKSFIDELKETYDYVILDTPPVGLVTDAQVLSKYVDGVLLVVASNQIEKSIIAKSKKVLEDMGANIVGVVLNKVEVKAKDVYYYAYEESFESDLGKLSNFTGSSRKRFRR